MNPPPPPGGSANNDPDAVDSPYPLGGVDPEVTLAAGEFVLAGGGHRLVLPSGRIFVSSRPTLGLHFEGAAERGAAAIQHLALGGWEPDTIEVNDGELRGTVHPGVSFRGHITAASEGSVSAAGSLGDLRSEDGDVERVLFHVANFADIHGTLIKRGASLSARRLELRAGGWRILLDGRHDLKEVTQALRTGGYAFTHTGLLRREDGGTFATKDAESVLEALHWFLSFVRGLWVGPLLLEGASSDGALVWRSWRVPRAGRWRGVRSWCDPLGWDAAQEAFSGFMAEWAAPFTNSVMRVAVGQYISANAPDPVEVAIIVAQSGLELLGWTTFVESGQIDPTTWKRHMPAHEKIQRLLDHATIDSAIPSTTPALAGLDPNWATGPAAIAGVRNRLVHPSNKHENAGWPGDVLVDAWTLSTHYLELSLLHRLGVRAAVRNRLNPNPNIGAKTPPPWV